jgi:hypothetical protein
MTVEVPSEAGEITTEWLSVALAEGGLAGAAVSGIEATRIGEGVGFMGELHRLAITYADAPDGAPTSVIAKMPTADPGGRTMGTMLRLYEKESGFYRHLSADCPAPTAGCFYNGAEPEAQKWCLLLEDLADHEPGDQLRPRTLDETVAMITTLARIHATWSDGRADVHEWLPKVDDPCSAGMVAMFDDAYPVTMERYSHVIPAYMHDWGPRFAPTALDWIADFAAQPGTIVHGDYRTDNFLFAADGSSVLLDWQLASRGPGAYDLYYFLAMSPDPDVVCEHFDMLVDLYLAELAAGGATPPPRDVLLDQMRGIGLWFTVLGIVTFSMIDPANTRGEELFLSMWRRGFQVAERLDLAPALP